MGYDLLLEWLLLHFFLCHILIRISYESSKRYCMRKMLEGLLSILNHSPYKVHSRCTILPLLLANRERDKTKNICCIINFGKIHNCCHGCPPCGVSLPFVANGSLWETVLMWTANIWLFNEHGHLTASTVFYFCNSALLLVTLLFAALSLSLYVYCALSRGLIFTFYYKIYIKT